MLSTEEIKAYIISVNLDILMKCILYENIDPKEAGKLIPFNY